MENRNELKDYLLTMGIETAVHYPIPIHLQPAARKLGYKLGSFPLAEEQAEKIITLPKLGNMNFPSMILIPRGKKWHH